MAVYDLEEQDQIDDLKAWWARYGGAITVGLVLGLLVIAGVQGWRWWSGKRAEDASVLYTAVSEAARAKDPAKAKDAIAQITDRYAGTALRAARRAAVREDALRQRRSRRREGAVRVGGRACEGRRAAGDRALSPRAGADRRKAVRRGARARSMRSIRTSFDGMFADLRGDALAAAGRAADARSAYEMALAKLDPKSPYRTYVQVKHDALGGAAPQRPRRRRPPAAGTRPPATSGAPAASAADTRRRRRGAGEMTRLLARARSAARRCGSAWRRLREPVAVAVDVVDARIPVPSFAWLTGGSNKPGPMPALNATVTPRINWQQSVGKAGPGIAPAVTASAVYAAAIDGTLMRLDAATGRADMASERRAPAVGRVRGQAIRSSSSAPTRVTCSRSTPTARRSGRRAFRAR